MYKATFVMCDIGFLPGYLTLVLYFIVLILVHILLINPIAMNKNNITTKISRFISKCKKKKFKIMKIQKILPVVIIAIVLLVMFLLYPVITNKYCPHKFWELFGINTL